MLVAQETVVFRKGTESLYPGVSAQKVADEISDIGESATPKQIVDKARNSETELHKCFEWNDEAAAEKYRIHQARTLVGNLVTVRYFPEQKDKETRQVRVFFKADGGYSGGYQQTEVIIKDDDKYHNLLEQAKEELRRFKEKYYILKELKPIFDLID